MKRLVSIALVVLAAAVAFAQETSRKKKQAAAGGDEQTLSNLEQDWGVALVKRDLAAIDRITSPDWVLSTPDGKLQTKAEADAELKSGVITFESFRIDDLKVRVYGNSAVVLGLETEKSTYKGVDISGQYRFTDFFVKRDGRWQCVATHSSKVVKK